MASYQKEPIMDVIGGPTLGVNIILGEVAILITAMQRTNRWSSVTHQEDDQDNLVKNLHTLKDMLNKIGSLSDMDPNQFLGPFLDVIRSEVTKGPVTGMALSSVDKFLSYRLINLNHTSTPTAVDNIADAVTHARFVGTDSSSDEVVLMRILQVLRKLLLCPLGAVMTNESVCEIMQSCFRFCFETRLSELLRRSAEHALVDMIQLLFFRLPQFKEDSRSSSNWKRLKMRTGGLETSRSRRGKSKASKPKTQPSSNRSEEDVPVTYTSGKTSVPSLPKSEDNSSIDRSKYQRVPITEDNLSLKLTPDDDSELVVCGFVDPLSAGEDEVYTELGDAPELLYETRSAKGHQTSSTSRVDILKEKMQQDERVIHCSPVVLNMEDNPDDNSVSSSMDASGEISTLTLPSPSSNDVFLPQTPKSIPHVSTLSEQMSHQDYINQQGVRFTQQHSGYDGTVVVLIPYGLPCLRELFRFLISLINPQDKQNSESMIQIGLNLITIALEVSSGHLSNYPSLLALVKDELCRNLFTLLFFERMTIFASTLRICFLMFESLRSQLKFQLEMYMNKISQIIEAPNASYEQREATLGSLLHIWRIPGLITELYLNFDCDLYCNNLYEDLTKLLSKVSCDFGNFKPRKLMRFKIAFPVNGLYSVQLLSLDTLLTVIDAIESHCHSRILSESSSVVNETSQEYLDKAHLPKEEIPFITVQNPSIESENSSIVSRSIDRYNVVPENIPSHEELMAIKHKKKILASGTEHFNAKPSTGIQFLQDHGLLSPELEPQEVVHFLKENPKLNKHKIGDFISNRKNLKILEAFVGSFDFTDMRIDESLRLYLETFRLPGEAPLISLIMEQFAEHWHKCNCEPFANTDAAFTLAYAIIMLNVDQHNYNVKKQNNPMTKEEFKKNVSGVNGGKDFDPGMLGEIYNSIKSEEIVMPAEQTGIVLENYLWTVLLRRGNSKDGIFLNATEGILDHDLFGLCWGPTVAALSFVFDRSLDPPVVYKTISGFRKCAMISAHYGMSDVFDHLIITLCKFTSLINSSETTSNIAITFGSNAKGQLAAETLFKLVHRHGDILREGWKNLLDCLLQLFKCGLLPEFLMEAEDFVTSSGTIRLLREEVSNQRTETGLFSSLYSYIAMSESSSSKVPTIEDQEHIQHAKACVKNCHPEQLITESKFLRMDALQELVKALIFASHGPDGHVTVGGTTFDEDATVFLLEMLVKVVIQNKDRAPIFWPIVRDHLYALIMGASASEHFYLMERAVVALLRLAIRLMRREDMGPIVLQSLRMLLLLKPATLSSVSRQVSYGLHELLKSVASNIRTASDWSVLFTLLECVGAGAQPPKPIGETSDNRSMDKGDTQSDIEHSHQGRASDTMVDSGHGSERGCTSDTEIYTDSSGHRSNLRPSSSSSCLAVNTSGLHSASSGWILVGKEGEIEPLPIKPLAINQYNIVHDRRLASHDPLAFVKSCTSLAFLIRDVAHITPDNFGSCVQCIRTFVEASLNGGRRFDKKSSGAKETKLRKKPSLSKRHEDNSTLLKRSRSTPQASSAYDADESDSEEMPDEYIDMSLQLLDLMHTLHTRAGHIFQLWSNEGEKSHQERKYICNVATNCSSLWSEGWCPLLQGIARLCCDVRKQIRMTALTYLQRSLLVHDLQGLDAIEWEACFNKVLFPLLTKLLEPLPISLNPSGMDETRMRAATLLSKVFLQHLNPLLTLPTFAALWLTIVDFIDKYMHVEKSDLLLEAIPESLKNMLLVMYTTGIFHDGENYTRLWKITWDRVDPFLPNLRDELFKEHHTTGVTKKMKGAGDNVGGVTGEPREVITRPKSVHGSATHDYDMTEGVASNGAGAIETKPIDGSVAGATDEMKGAGDNVQGVKEEAKAVTRKMKTGRDKVTEDIKEIADATPDSKESISGQIPPLEDTRPTDVIPNPDQEEQYPPPPSLPKLASLIQQPPTSSIEASSSHCDISLTSSAFQVQTPLFTMADIKARSDSHSWNSSSRGVSAPISLCTPSCPLLLNPSLVEGTAIPHIPFVSHRDTTPKHISNEEKGISKDI